MPTVDDFLKRWSGSSGSERANAQQFFIDLCDLLGVERPRVSGPDFEDYRFEKAVWVPNPDGGGTQRFIDLCKRDWMPTTGRRRKTTTDS